MKFNIGFIPTLLLLIPVIFACFKTPADKPELEDENLSSLSQSVWADLAA